MAGMAALVFFWNAIPQPVSTVIVPRIESNRSKQVDYVLLLSNLVALAILHGLPLRLARSAGSIQVLPRILEGTSAQSISTA